MAHRIRLRKPWSRQIETRPTAPTGSPPTGYVEVRRDERIDLPDVVDDEAHGDQAPVQEEASRRPIEYRVTYQRKFNRPSGLGDDRVRLAIERYRSQNMAVDLNGHRLVPVPDHADAEIAAQFDMTDQLLDHNELTVTLESPSFRPHITGEVSLLIHTKG